MEFEKDITEISKSELKNREMKIRKEMESITESITIPAVKFEKEKMMKKRLHVKNTWYDWLNNYVP